MRAPHWAVWAVLAVTGVFSPGHGAEPHELGRLGGSVQAGVSAFVRVCMWCLLWLGAG